MWLLRTFPEDSADRVCDEGAIRRVSRRLVLVHQADLDYFLRLTNAKELNIRCLGLEIIHMLEGGASGQHTKSRFNQVKTSYSEAFGNLWWVPFVSRYIRRVISAVLQ